MTLSPFQESYMETLREEVTTSALNYYAQVKGNQDAEIALHHHDYDNDITYEAVNVYQEGLFDNLQRIEDNEVVDLYFDEYPVEPKSANFTEDEYTEYVNQHNENLRVQISYELDAISRVKNYERIRENETDIDLTSGLADLSNSSQLGL